MKIGIFTSCVMALAASAMLFPCAASAQQIYKWVDEQGNVHYGNDPYKAPKGTPRVETKGRGFVSEHYMVEEDQPAAEVKQNGDQEKPAQPATNGKGVEVVGGAVEFLNTDAGLTLVKATLKNNFDYPVEGLRLDVVLWFQDTTRSEVVSIPYLGGKPQGKLDSKASGVLEYELNYNPADISGYEFQVVWAYFEKAPKPVEGESAEGVFHKMIPGKAKEPAPGAATPAETKSQSAAPSKEESYAAPKSRRTIRMEERRKQAAEATKAKQGQESGSPSQ